jgi:hypothetical protein
MEGEILNPIHVEVLLEGQNAAPATGQSAKTIPVLSQSAKPIVPAPVGLDEPESAKLTPLVNAALEALESAKLTYDRCPGCLQGVL